MSVWMSLQFIRFDFVVIYKIIRKSTLIYMLLRHFHIQMNVRACVRNLNWTARHRQMLLIHAINGVLLTFEKKVTLVERMPSTSQ